jgi:hypothetical protein
MLQVLQYLTGTSMADEVEVKDLIRSQAVLGGARVRGSSVDGGGGKVWRLRGRIWEFGQYRCQMEEVVGEKEETNPWIRDGGMDE